VSALLLPLAWAVLALAVAALHRPGPRRARVLLARPRPPCAVLVTPAGDRMAQRDRAEGDAAGPTGARRADPLPLLGRALCRAAGRAPPPPDIARRLGRAAAVGLAAVAVLPWAALPAAAVAWYLPAATARRRARRSEARLAADLPEVVDLLVLAVGAGCNVRHALAAVARHGDGPLAAELGRCHDAAGRGRRLADELEQLPGRAGEAVRPLVAALVASERYGAPLADSLRRLADDVRRDRRRRAEEAARRVPVALLFPLVLCTLPAFALLTLAPLIAGALQALRL
jgi:Flp pilus assembly protein TadB